MAEKTVPAVQEKETPVTREETREGDYYLQPPVDIYETEEGLTAVADLPGVGKDGLSINVDDSVLTIEGRAKAATNGNPIWSEYRLLNFYRQFQLPEEVDREKISAEMKNGVLTVRLPKAEKAKPKQIDVKVE